MPFNAEQERKIQQWLVSKEGLPSCASCGTDSWGLHPEIVVAPNLLGGDGGSVDVIDGFGLLILFCNNCGRVVPFVAKDVLGI